MPEQEEKRNGWGRDGERPGATPAQADAPVEGTQADMPADETQAQALSLQERQAEQLEETDASDAREEPAFEKTMELRYRITFDQYYEFQWLLGKEQFQKSIKRNTVLGIVEIGLGLFYLVSLIVTSAMGAAPMGMTPYVLAVLIIGLGVYSLVYYRGMFEKRFRKMLKNQYARMPYLQNEIVVDVYPNHVTEYFDGQPQESYFYKMKGVKETEHFFIVFLEERRCLLVPKEAVSLEQREAYSRFLDEVCQNFEKPRNLE